MTPQNVDFLIHGGILDCNLEQEAVEFGFRKSVSTFMLDRVLCGDDHVGCFHRVRMAIDRYLPLFHYFKQRSLGLGRRAVDFVNEDYVGEYWSRLELKRGCLEVVNRRSQYIRRHKVGCKLYPREVHGDDAGHQSRS